MSTERPTEPNETRGAFKPKPPEFLNYFGKERWIHLWLAEKRTRLISAVVPPFERLGLAPDTISYTGIAFLAGVVLFYVRMPSLAVLFLAGHIICDGLDGAFARHAGRASQSGAFTDLVCDQLGMLAVALMAIFHQLVSPLLGAVYVTLYLIVVVFGVIINVMGIGSRVTLTSKYVLYIVYAIWAFGKVNLLPHVMSLFSALMAIEVVVGYLRLKRGLRRKFDSPERFGKGDAYSGKLNYALNVAVPIVVFVAIVVGANIVAIRAMFATPRMAVQWKEAEHIIPESEAADILGVGLQGKSFLVLTRDENHDLWVRKFPVSPGTPAQSFSVPGYIHPAFGALPVDDGILLLGDRTTRLLMGIDVDESFRTGRAVIVSTLPMGWLRVTGMALGQFRGKKIWLVANYLSTRKTYVVDPQKALKSGALLEGKVSSYTNGGFPSGMTFFRGSVMEYNRSPLSGLIYVAPLDRAIKGSNLLDVGKISFRPPVEGVLGPLVDGNDVVMVSRSGRVYRLALLKVFKD